MLAILVLLLPTHALELSPEPRQVFLWYRRSLLAGITVAIQQLLNEIGVSQG